MFRHLSAALLCLTLAACNLQQDISARGDVAGSGQAATPVSGTTTDGHFLSASLMQGKVTVIDFWGSWCGPCRAEQSDLNTLYSRYHARGVVFIGIDMRDDDASANAYRHDYSVPYSSIDDSSGAVSGEYDVAAPPTLIVVDKSGHIVTRLLGTLTGSAAALDKALGS